MMFIYAVIHLKKISPSPINGAGGVSVINLVPTEMGAILSVVCTISDAIVVEPQIVVL